MFQIKKNKITFTELNKMGFEESKNIHDNINEIVLPEGLEEILENAFFDNINLKKINVPKTVSKICTHSFWGLDGLEEIILFPTIKTIEKHAFCNCVNLTIKIMCDKTALPKDWHKECFANVKDIKYIC